MPEPTPGPTPEPYKLPDNADRSIKITNDSLTVTVGKPLKLLAEITKLTDDAPDKSKLEWLSVDESIAKVNAQGAVTGVAPGSVKIVCQLQDRPDIKALVEISVIQPIKSIKADDIILLLGAEEDKAKGKVDVQYNPDNASVQECSFASSDESVVTVDAEGNLQAIAAGKAKINIVPLEEGTKAKATCNVTVGQAVKSIRIPSKRTIDKSKTYALKPEIKPTNAIVKTVEYSSSNEKVATVGNNGVIKAVGTGNATITCKAKDGSGVFTECEITVIQPVTKVSTKQNRIVLFEGDTKKWYTTIEPYDATMKELNYSSDSSWAATIDSDGKITAKHAGKATITATSKDGSKRSCKCSVVVEPIVPISLDSIAHGIFNYNLLGLTVPNKTSTMGIVDFDFIMAFYDWSGSMINAGSYSLGSPVSLGPGKQMTIKHTVYGAGQAYKTVITITGVKFKNGTYYSIPSSKQETWSFTR